MNIASAVQDEIEETFDRIDQNGDRRISFGEFAALMMDMDHTRTPAALRLSFDAIDRDRDGLVSPEEFNTWLLPQGTR